MSVIGGTPHPALRGVVLRYGGFQDHSGIPVTFRELPCSFVPIIIDLDVGWTVAHHGPAAPLQLGSFVAGVTAAPVLVGHPGSACCLQIDLTALGARRLLGIPMSELANRTVPIEAVLGRDGRDLVQRVGNTSDWADRFALVDRAVRARLADRPEVDTGVAWSMHRIATSGGNLTIGELAAELGWSHRKFIAQYRDSVGLAPKMVARIVRFERLTTAVTCDPQADWADTAQSCGYFDQAHLAREVRDLAGVTPTALRTEIVNSVQDGLVSSA